MADENANEKVASWEKTVEWAFVRKYLSNAEFAAPIDGDHEISDAILAQRGQWFLIEFKHTENEFKSERNKYPTLSNERTYSVLKRNYPVDNAVIEEIKKIKERPKWLNSIANYEHNLRGGIENKEKFREESLLAKAQRALKGLITRYAEINGESENNLEPHFFVFSNDNKFDQLLAHPYWTYWLDNLKKPRERKTFDPDHIGMYGQNYYAFSDYVRELALARGYNVEELGNGGQTDFKAVVFGRVSGFTRNRAISMSLNTFLLLDKDLEAAYKLSNSLETKRPARAVHQPKDRTQNPPT
ncbi:hypothetical protein [Noviherbaspirillum suwonense]|uniref:Uncharacterized protein n=1 Tax=Noviherbaspirillum suwonense TaxID=1224511 RepID=A0ABY1QJ84_9BURK|nr:hypothetical protein [Noviherbaspirillum suwonense]SMP72678.1 hypothetical protein SAMN06295970_11891 [Noviherbaspirillum suwonense]